MRAGPFAAGQKPEYERQRYLALLGLRDVPAVARDLDTASEPLMWRSGRTRGHRSVAVLPFANLSADPENVKLAMCMIVLGIIATATPTVKRCA